MSYLTAVVNKRVFAVLLSLLDVYQGFMTLMQFTVEIVRLHAFE